MLNKARRVSSTALTPNADQDESPPQKSKPSANNTWARNARLTLELFPLLFAPALKGQAQPPKTLVMPQHVVWNMDRAAEANHLGLREKSEDPRARAQLALSRGQPVEFDSEYIDRIKALREKLQAAGLPTSAEGVPVMVIDSDTHGDATTRTIASEQYGVAPGADVAYYDMAEVELSVSARFKSKDKLLSALYTSASNKGYDKPSIEAWYERTTTRFLAGYHQTLGMVEHAAAVAPKGKTSIANISMGTSIRDFAESQAEHLFEVLKFYDDEPEALRAVALSAAGYADVDAMKKDLSEAPLSVHTAIVETLTRGAEAQLKMAPYAKQLRQLDRYAQRVFRSAERASVVVVVAAGNSHEDNDSAAVARINQQAYPIVVSAHDLGEKRAMADFSEQGELAAPGVQLPVGSEIFRIDGERRFFAKNVNGTSFAAPHVVGAIALMLKINPKLSPKQIQHALKNTAIDIPKDDRDGHGALDVVAAIASITSTAP